MWFYLPTVSPLWHPLIPLCNIPVFLFPLFICLLFQVSPAFPIVCHTPLFILLPLTYFVSVILFSQVEQRILVRISVPPGGGTHITRDMCFPGGGTHITRDMCVPGGGTHITRDMCFPCGGTHITRDVCLPCGGTHTTRDMCFPCGGTHITRDMCFPAGGTHITYRDMSFSGKEHISLAYVFPR